MNETTYRAQQATGPRAQVLPDTLEDAGATAAAMLNAVAPVEMNNVYRTYYRDAAGEFANGFRAYVLRQHEAAGR